MNKAGKSNGRGTSYLYGANGTGRALVISTVCSTMDMDRQMVKEFVNFVLPGCGEWTIACKQNHENS
jgi:predicted RNA-binding Zn-ribbon protein involved in translation (DUF1610 family)